MSAREFFDSLETRVDPARTAGMNNSYLFDIEGAGKWKVEVHDGPPVWVKNAEDFLRKWRRSSRRVAGPYIRGERWVVEVWREAVDAAARLKRDMRTLSLGRDLDKAAKRGMRILVDAGAIRKPYAAAITGFYDKRFAWER